MKSTKQPAGQLARLTTLGGLLGIKTAPLLPRLAPVAAACDDKLVVTISHGFDAMSVTTRVARSVALDVCGPWLDALAGDQLDLAIDATSIAAFSDEAALPASAPPLVQALGADELAALAYDGAAWTYVIDQPNADDAEVAATLARIDQVAAELGVTAPQRRIAATLHQSLARGMTSRAWVRVRDGAVDPVLCLAWDRVEWAPIQSMHRGFYPAGRGVEMIARLSRSADSDHATVELELGRTDPPAMRFSIALV